MRGCNLQETRLRVPNGNEIVDRVEQDRLHTFCRAAAFRQKCINKKRMEKRLLKKSRFLKYKIREIKLNPAKLRQRRPRWVFVLDMCMIIFEKAGNGGEISPLFGG